MLCVHAVGAVHETCGFQKFLVETVFILHKSRTFRRENILFRASNIFQTHVLRKSTQARRVLSSKYDPFSVIYPGK